MSIILPLEPSPFAAPLPDEFDEAEAHAVTYLARATPEQPFTSFRIRQHSMDLSVAAKVGVPGITSADASVNGKALVYEAKLIADEKLVETDDGTLYIDRWQAGLELGVKVSEIKCNLNMNFGTVSFAARHSLATTQLSLETMGGVPTAAMLGSDLEPGVLKQEDGLEKVISVVSQMIDHMGSPETDLEAVRRRYYFGLGEADDFEKAQATVYAMHCIRAGLELSKALDNSTADRGLDPREIKRVYYSVLDSFVDNEKPNRDHVRIAREWLNV